MREDFPFLRAIFHEPGHDLPRLIYADWLEERGDPRAEFLRLDVEQRSPASGKGRRAALTKQLKELTPQFDRRWVERMWQTRNLADGARLDLALIEDGLGRIEVRGGEQETVLLVDGQPVALNWDDCQGSVGQYLVFTGHTRGDDYARQLKTLVEEGIDGRPLAEQIGPLLAAFSSGIYCIGYTPSTVAESVAVLEYPALPGSEQELLGYYPFDQSNLVCTQPRASLDEQRVAYFRKQIEAKRRPLVLTASAEGAWCEFVIDGHHKLAAYDQAHVRPSILSIIRWQPPRISLQQGLSFLPSNHPGIQEYRRMKRSP